MYIYMYKNIYVYMNIYIYVYIMFFGFRIELLVDWRVTGNQRDMIEKEIMGTMVIFFLSLYVINK